MNLLSLLLIATAVLAVSAGLLTLAGALKTERGKMIWFFISTLGTAVWCLSIAGFMGAPETTSDGVIRMLVYGIYLGPLVAVPAFLGYSSWKYGIGKVATSVYIVLAVTLGVVLVRVPSLWMEDLVLNRVMGNSVVLVRGWFYALYGLFFVVCFVLSLGFLFYRIRHTKKKRARMGDFMFAIGMLGASGFIGLFDIILPYFSNYSLIWIGPIAMVVVTLIFFYSVIRYRIISVNSGWMKAMAYVVVMTSGVMVYMLLFYMIFTVLFKIPNPSASVLVLNFLMIVIVLLLMPVINELIAVIKSMVSVGQVDIAYVIKKLNKIATKNIDLRELAGFLADHLHFAYIGFIVNGKLYSSKPLVVSTEELNQITKMRAAVGSSMWQEPNKTTQKTLDELGLKAVAELRNAKGKSFGQLIVGKPLGKKSFERRDLVQLEMIINLVATVIDSEKHIRA